MQGGGKSGSMIVKSAEQFVSEVLRDGLWHTTAQDRFESILADGLLKPEPNLPDELRHKTANGPSNYPYVRTLSGVSLFDFTDFDSQSYEAACPVSNWRAFVPVWTAWQTAIWIELNRDKIGAFISGPDLLDRWKSERAHAHTIMPVIEAAHVGDIPTVAFRRSLIATRLPDGGCRITAGLRASRSAQTRS